MESLLVVSSVKEDKLKKTGFDRGANGEGLSDLRRTSGKEIYSNMLVVVYFQTFLGQRTVVFRGLSVPVCSDARPKKIAFVPAVILLHLIGFSFVFLLIEFSERQEPL
jgi:hypothetical protein